MLREAEMNFKENDRMCVGFPDIYEGMSITFKYYAKAGGEVYYFQ